MFSKGWKNKLKSLRWQLSWENNILGIAGIPVPGMEQVIAFKARKDLIFHGKHVENGSLLSEAAFSFPGHPDSK